MTARTIADCEACRDALTELVCDELDAETRSVVLAHTQTCPGCAAELVKMRAVLQVAESIPLEAPSARVHAAVMVAAREANVRREALAQASPSAKESAFELLRTWLRQLGTWAMSPQVAMASVLLLMLGVGLVALPLGQDREQTALRAAHEAEEIKPATASGAVAPSSPAVQTDLDAPLGSPSTEGQTSEAELRSKKEATSLAKPAAKRREAARAAGKSLAARNETTDDSKVRGASERMTSGSGALKGIGAQGAGAAAVNRSQQQARPEPRVQESLRAREAPADFAPAPPPTPQAAAASTAQENSDAYAGSAQPAPKKADSAPEDQLLAQGIGAARAGDYAGAIAVLKPLADQGSADVRRQAALWLARSYRATGDCPAALRRYAPLVQSASASPALLGEALDCYERTGDTQAAAVLRSRVQSIKETEGSSTKPAALPKN